MHVADTASIASRIELAFQSASNSTGTSFEYLVKTAARESSFNPVAKAKTSSATGLFQFIESTWLETMKEAGPRHGLTEYSDHIEQSRNGRYHVSDPEVRQKILDLRNDPEISSMMAGALTQKNANYLERKIGRVPSDGELYMAHFLGATGASRLIDAAGTNPDMRADRLFTAQARANKSVFYHQNGNARSMLEVYEVIVSKHDAVTMIAEASGFKEPHIQDSLSNVAALPSAKPFHAQSLDYGINSGDFGDASAGRFAFRANQVDKQQDGQNAFPELFSRAESGKDNEVDEVTSRVLSAFQATDTASPFEALFRNDPGSVQAVVDSRFAATFAAVEEAARFSSFTGVSNQVAAQELALNDQGRPLDLTRFLTLQTDEEKNDLLPPA